MQQANAILETLSNVDLPTGSYFGVWDGHVVQFKVDNMEQICEVPTKEASRGKQDVLVAIWEKLIYIYERNSLR